MTNQNKKRSFLTTFVSIFVAIAITGTTFYIEQKAADSFNTSSTKISSLSISEGTNQFKSQNTNWQTASPNQTINSGDTFRTGSNSHLELTIFQDNILRLNQNTEATITYSQTSPHQIFIQVPKGQIWLNSQFSSDQINIIHPGITLIPHNSIVEANFNDTEVQILNHIEETTIAFINPQSPQTNFLTRTDRDKFINSFLLVGGRQTTILKEKISLKIAPLLYSKLVKEFNYGRINYQSLPQDWFNWNLSLDQKHQDELTNIEIERIKKRGLVHKEVNLEPTFLEKTEDLFTISKTKETERLLNRAFAHIDDVKLLLLQNQQTKIPFRIKEFEKAIANLQISPETQNTVKKLLSQEYSTLRSIAPQDTLYPAKETIFKAYFDAMLKSNDQLQTELVLRSQLHEGFRTVAINEIKAREILQKYGENLKLFLNQYKSSLSDIEFLLAEDNQIMAQLISIYPSLYRDEIFEIKSVLEDAWLKLLPDGPDLQEEKQTLILQKITLLKKLQYFLFEEQLDVDNAKKIVLRLIQEIQSLQDTTSQTAVQEIFSQELADFNNFWRYLNSPEYSSPSASGIHGATHKERYDKFLRVIAENAQISEISSEILGITETPDTTKTTTQIIEDVIKELQAAGLSKVSITPISLNSPTTTITNSNFSSKPFTSTYNWQTKVLSDITFDGKTIPDATVKVGNLKSFLSTFEETSTQPTTPTTETEESKLDRTAKSLVSQKLKDNGLDISPSQITITELQKAEFKITKLIYSKQPLVTMDFDYNSKSNIISNITVEASFGTLKVPGQINIGTEDFTQVIEAKIQEFNSRPAATTTPTTPAPTTSTESF